MCNGGAEKFESLGRFFLGMKTRFAHELDINLTNE